MKSNPILRIRLLTIALVVLAVVLVSRLFFLQIIKHGEYSDLANRQYLNPGVNLFNRGSIYFSYKDGRLFAAATIKSGYLLAINPKQISNPQAYYQKLSPLITDLDQEAFLKSATKVDDPYEEIANRLDQKTVDKIKKLKLTGVYIYKEKWRAYPAGTLGAHVIGLLGYQGDEYAGRYGLEKKFQSILSRDKELTFVNFFAELFSGLGGKLTNKSDRGAGDLVLTIEPTVQSYLEKELQNTTEHWQAEAAGGLVLDPQTGELLGMATLPNFNPNNVPDNLRYLNNPLVESVFEMGSIVKPLTMAAAIDTGKVTSATTYNDLGYLVINGRRIENYDGRGRGVVSMQEVLSQSLNTGSVFAMRTLGKKDFRRYFLNYGVGEKTGIDLPDEVAGIATNLDSTQEVEFATASFGQGIAWTPIAIARALATLGNGGMLVKPYLVKDIRYQTMITEKHQTNKAKSVLKPETSQEITRMLIKVVDDSLAGGKVKLPHHTIAAKTGTAQMASPGGGYYSDRYLHSFFGYFPATSPRFLVFLYVVNPQGVRYSSETLTEPFINLSRFLLNYYEVPPDR